MTSSLLIIYTPLEKSQDSSPIPAFLPFINYVLSESFTQDQVQKDSESTWMQISQPAKTALLQSAEEPVPFLNYPFYPSILTIFTGFL